MNVKIMRPFFIALCLVLFSCSRASSEDVIINNVEVKAFVNYLFAPGSTLIKNKTEDFLLQEEYALSFLSTNMDICSSERPCNKSKESYLVFTPNFLFETENGRKKVTGADPDAFVDLFDIGKSKYYRVSATGTEGSIYGTFWLSDFSFVVYGMEFDAGFVDVFYITAKKKTSYTIDKAKRKHDADLDTFLIAKYGHVASLQSP